MQLIIDATFNIQGITHDTDTNKVIIDFNSKDIYDRFDFTIKDNRKHCKDYFSRYTNLYIDNRFQKS